MVFSKGNEDNKNIKKGHTYVQWITAILANFTLLTYGMQAGWISPMTKVLQSDLSPAGKPLTDEEISWIASVLCIAGMLSVPFYSYVADKYGRKASVILISIPQALCWMVKIISPCTTGLLISRVLSGIASGGCFNIVPIYTKEISQEDTRGKLGSLLFFCQNIGILMMYVMGVYLEFYTVLWASLWVPIVITILMLKAPETPPFLVKVGKFEEAAATLAFLRGLSIADKEIQNEINILKNQDLQYKNIRSVSIINIFQNRLWRYILLAVLALICAQANNGAFAIITYAVAILSTAGVTFSPELQTFSFPIVMLMGSFVTLLIVDKVGRKVILSTGFFVNGIAFSSVGALMLLRHWGYIAPGWLTVLLIVICIFTTGFSIAPIPYVMMSEVTNFQIRAKVVGCAVMTAWFMSFLQLIIFPPASAALGLHAMFFAFGIVHFVGIYFTLAFLPETRGKEVEEIEEEICKRLNKI